MYLNVKDFVEAERRMLTQMVSMYGPGMRLTIFATKHDPATDSYMKNKIKVAEQVGIKAIVVDMSTWTYQQIEERLMMVSSPAILQLPLRDDLKHKQDSLIEQLGICDMDGLSSLSRMIPATALGIAEYIKTLDLPDHPNALIINRSKLIGRPLVKLLLDQNFTVTVAHSKTSKSMLENMIGLADVIVTATGIPDFLKPLRVFPKTIVIDAGISRNAEGKLCGDCSAGFADEDTAKVTPVPGGVGQLTTTFLMYNVAKYYLGTRRH